MNLKLLETAASYNLLWLWNCYIFLFTEETSRQRLPDRKKKKRACLRRKVIASLSLKHSVEGKHRWFPNSPCAFREKDKMSQEYSQNTTGLHKVRRGPQDPD